MENQRRAEKHAAHVLTGFELSQIALNKSSQFGIKGVTLNVLWCLTSCYNPKNKYVFPKQKTIAQKISATERSVVRAIQELVNKGLIIVECKSSNRYLFTSKLLGEAPQNEKNFYIEKMSEDNEKISGQSENLSPHIHEQTKEQIKEQTVIEKEPVKVDDYKILKDYVVKNGAKNIQAYVNWLKRNGCASDIIAKHKEKIAADRCAAKQIEKTTQLIETWNSWTADSPYENETWVRLKAKLERLKNEKK